MPRRVRVAPPDVGPFEKDRREATGESYVNDLILVPTTALTVTNRDLEWPLPVPDPQVMLVVECHELVPQSTLEERRIVGVASVA
jgi:hypothetical protein